ncbi:MAG TPA: c-type cytochrome [Phaeodactylibacter sp.]|nr:c-type cytochrome [Phaeodactylibacter sp.]
MIQRISKTVIVLLILANVFSSCQKDEIKSSPLVDAPIEDPTEIFKFIPQNNQRSGDVEDGYNYLIYGDYLDSGAPIDLYLNTIGTGPNRLNRTGDNADVRYNYTAVNAPNGVRVVTSNCLTCHAQMLNGELVIGLGNAVEDYTKNQSENITLVDQTIKTLYGNNSPEWEAYQPYSRGIHAIAPSVMPEVRGVSPADKLAVTLASYINKHDLSWLGQSQLPIPKEVVPSDVPPWWLLKKKNAIFHSGVGRGDFARVMIASNGLTVTDSVKAREVDNHFDDVLAYIYSLEAPKYPNAIDETRVTRGETLFNKKCATCHGTYGVDESYPNLLISMEHIGTDPLLARSNFSYAFFVDWYNSSWFSKGENAGYLKPQNGYMAPPLDGIWATAPYLHNGSVPTLEDVLNSSQRPEKWKRSYSTAASEYDQEKLGWKYTIETISGSKIVYDTTLPGYGNQGHTFGDDLTDEERKDLLEYLKTL